MTDNSCQTVLRGWIERTGAAQRKIRVYARRRKNTGEKRAECSTHGVNAERIERIIIAEPGFKLCACKERNYPGSNPDDHRAARRYVSAGWCDHNETGHGTRAKAEHTRFTAQRILEHGPRKRGDRRRKCGSRERVCRDSIRREGAACIEAIP